MRKLSLEKVGLALGIFFSVIYALCVAFDEHIVFPAHRFFLSVQVTGCAGQDRLVAWYHART